MSSATRVNQSDFQSSKLSPKNSNMLTTSRHLSPSSRAKCSDDGSSSLQSDQLLKLQIKQLQRQNKFLKKKICQLTAQLNGDVKFAKKKTVQGKGMRKDDLDPTHVTYQFFYKQVNNLLNSVADLYKVQINNDELKQYSSKFQQQHTLDPNKRYVLYKKSTLSRKLQKISLQTEQKRYNSLLDLFIQYYTVKQQCDKYIRERADSLSNKVLELNKLIFQNASKKKNSLKGSTVKSQYCIDDLLQKNSQVFPWSTTKATSPPTVINVKDSKVSIILQQGDLNRTND